MKITGAQAGRARVRTRREWCHACPLNARDAQLLQGSQGADSGWNAAGELILREITASAKGKGCFSRRSCKVSTHPNAQSCQR